MSAVGIRPCEVMGDPAGCWVYQADVVMSSSEGEDPDEEGELPRKPSASAVEGGGGRETKRPKLTPDRGRWNNK